MLGSTIQREIAQMIQRDVDDPRVPSIVSVTRVNVAPDLSTADVFVTIMGTPGQKTAALNALKHSAGMMRGKMTKSLSLRTAPFIKFHLDDKLDKEIAMMDLLDRVARENAEADRRRAGPDGTGEEPDATTANKDESAAGDDEAPARGTGDESPQDN
jgi:ribosome-binding factor A